MTTLASVAGVDDSALDSIAGVDVSIGGGGGSLSDQMPMLTTGDGPLANSIRTQLTATASATPYTAGSWVEIDSSLSDDMMGIYFFLASATNTGATNTSSLLEIGTGAASSETVWATVGMGWRLGSNSYFIPGFIAAGTRVAYRSRSAVASKTISGVFSFAPARSIVPSAPVSMGANTGTANGVSLTYAGSTNTKGAWVEIEDSTPSDFGLLASFVQAVPSGTVMAAAPLLMDIGIGAASAETVLIPDLQHRGANTESYQAYLNWNCFGVDVPAGSRLSARYATNSPDNTVGLTLVGA